MSNNEETSCEYFKQVNQKVARSVLGFLLVLLAAVLCLGFAEETIYALGVVGLLVVDDGQASDILFHQSKAVAWIWLLFPVPAVWFSVVCLQNSKKIGVYVQGLA